MTKWHQISWKEKLAMIEKFEDERLDPLLLESLKDNPYAKRVFNLQL